MLISLRWWSCHLVAYPHPDSVPCTPSQIDWCSSPSCTPITVSLHPMWHQSLVMPPYVFRKLWWGSKLIVSHEFPSTLHIPCHNAFAPHFRSITGHAPLTTLPLPCVFSKLRWGSKSITPHSIWHFLDLTCASITVSVHPTSHQSLVMPPHHLAPTPCV